MAFSSSYLNQNDSYLDPVKDVKQDQDVTKAANVGASAPTNNPALTRKNITAPDATSNIMPRNYNPASLPTTTGDDALNKLYAGPPAPAQPQNANDLGRSVGQTVGDLVRSSVGVLNRNIVQPSIGAANAAEDFTRGMFGYGPADRSAPSTSVIGSANAATPAAAPTATPAVPSYSGPMTRNLADESMNLMSRVSAPAPSNSGQSAAAVSAPGTAVFNGRVISPAEINRLANTNIVSSEAFRNPGLGTLGIPVSQDQGVRVAALNRTLPTFGPGEYSPDEAAASYKSDLASIINNDPRSVLGTAAHNAYADSVWDRNTGVHSGGGGRYGAGRPSDYQEKMGALLGYAANNFNAQNQAGNSNARDQTSFANVAQTQAGDTDRENSRAAAENARTSATLSRQLDRYETDPTTGKVTLIRNGVAQPVMDASGNAFAVKPAEDYTKLIGELAKNNVDASQVGSYIDAARAARNGGSATPVGTATATGKDGTKYKLSDDGKTWVKQNG